MKKIAIAFAFLCSANSYAAIDSITIDSIMAINSNVIRSPYLLEVCGRVKADEPVHVTIVSDPNTTRYAPYTTTVDENGAYCHVTANFSGRVLAVARPVHGKKGHEVQSEVKSLK